MVSCSICHSFYRVDCSHSIAFDSAIHSSHVLSAFLCANQLHRRQQLTQQIGDSASRPRSRSRECEAAVWNSIELQRGQLRSMNSDHAGGDVDWTHLLELITTLNCLTRSASHSGYDESQTRARNQAVAVLCVPTASVRVYICANPNQGLQGIVRDERTIITACLKT
jgi:hypothetical protein